MLTTLPGPSPLDSAGFSSLALLYTCPLAHTPSPLAHTSSRERPGPGCFLLKEARACDCSTAQPQPHCKLPEVGTGLQDGREKLQPTPSLSTCATQSPASKTLASTTFSGLARPLCFSFRSHRTARTSCPPVPPPWPPGKGRSTSPRRRGLTT